MGAITVVAAAGFFYGETSRLLRTLIDFSVFQTHTFFVALFSLGHGAWLNEMQSLWSKGKESSILK